MVSFDYSQCNVCVRLKHLSAAGFPDGTTLKEYHKVYEAKAKQILGKKGAKQIPATQFFPETQRNQFGRVEYNDALEPAYKIEANMILNARGGQPRLFPDYPPEWDDIAKGAPRSLLKY